MKSVAFKKRAASTRSVPAPPPGISDVDRLTEVYANAHQALVAAVDLLNDEIDVVKRRHIGAIRALVVSTKAAHADLYAVIDANRPAFERPRTRQLHGIKIGLRKLEGRLVFADEDKAVSLVNKLFPDQFDVLVKTTHSIVRDAAGQLSAADLKRLGGEVTNSVDEIVIKAVAGDVGKLVDALLKDAKDVE